MVAGGLSFNNIIDVLLIASGVVVMVKDSA